MCSVHKPRKSFYLKRITNIATRKTGGTEALAPRPPCRGTSCISCPSRMGKGHSGQPWRRSAPAWVLPPAPDQPGTGGSSVAAAAAPESVGFILRPGRLHQEQEPHRLGVDPVHHLVEQRERFLLELDQRVLLPVAAQPDSFLQVVEREQVVLPLGIDDIEQDVPLEPAKRGRAEESFPFLRSAL